MKPASYKNIPYETVIRLSPEQIEDPRSVIYEVLNYYGLKEIRKKLEEWLVASLSAESLEYEGSKERNNLLFLYTQLQDLIEANYVLLKSADQSSVTAKPQKKQKVKK